MTTLLIGIVFTLAASGAVMAGLDKAYHSPRFAEHHFAAPRPMRATEDERKWLYALNSLLSTLIIFGAAIYGFEWLFTADSIGIGWMLAQAVGILLVYDALYYALHRWVFHHRKLMRYVHGLHHRSRTPNARESIFTHPIELIAGLALFLFSTWIIGPVHVVAFSAAFLVYSLLNVIIHAGFAFPRGPLRLLNMWSRKHHGHHGVDPNKNFASLFPLWDVLLGTSI